MKTELLPQPYISIIFVGGKRGVLLYDNTRWTTDTFTLHGLRHKIAAIKRDKRKRVMVWQRTRSLAESAGEKSNPVLWVGHPKGPGNAHKLGWVAVDKLEEFLLTHMEWMK